MKRILAGLVVALAVMVAGCGTTGSSSNAQSSESGMGSVKMRISLYDNQGAVTSSMMVASRQQERVQDIMKGMTKKFYVYLYEIDGSGNFVANGLSYFSTAPVVDGVAEIEIRNVSAGRSYYVSVNGTDEDGLHVLFTGQQSDVVVSAGVMTDAEVSLGMVDMYWINDLVLSNIEGNYQQGGYYEGALEGFTATGNYNYVTSCVSLETGKLSCSAGIPTTETSTATFRISDANGVSHSYQIKVGIRDALADNRVEFDLTSGDINIGVTFKLDVDSIYVDNLTGVTHYVWYASNGGLPAGIAVGDVIHINYDDGMVQAASMCVVEMSQNGSDYDCMTSWSQLPTFWWNNIYYTAETFTPSLAVVRSASSPSGRLALTAGEELARFDVYAGSKESVGISSADFAISNAEFVSNVTLVDTASGTPLALTIFIVPLDGHLTINIPAGELMIPAGSVKHLSVRANVSPSASGIIKAGITGIAAVGHTSGNMATVLNLPVYGNELSAD